MRILHQEFRKRTVELNVDSDKALVVFQGTKIRRTWFNDEWWFSVVDAVKVLTESVDAKDYWYRLKQRESESSGIELSTFCRQLKLIAEDGKMRETDCATTESLLRIVQSIPSPNAEPFKLWLAKVGYDRIQEIQNPELAQKRMKELYKAKGYSDDWIEKRVRGIAIRDELTDEWKKRDVGMEREYAILTAEISKATFGMTPSEYKEFKGLKKENLRDHMNDLELIFTMLGEASTTKIARKKDARGFLENKEVAKEGGIVAGVARRELEQRSGEKVSVSENYLSASEKKKKLEDKSKK
ncbi:Bro-N domain-containing protein [Candidatus Woesearchaeota archaeon]|nr:Bro-N domain-containing protein [Candidatus Woesearchaeota archaeon]